MPANYDGHEILTANLRRLMYEQRMSQQDLADKIGMQRSAVSLIVSGNDLRVSTLYKLAKGLGVEAGMLLMEQPKAVTEAAPSNAAQSVIDAIATLLNSAKGNSR